MVLGSGLEVRFLFASGGKGGSISFLVIVISWVIFGGVGFVLV